MKWTQELATAARAVAYDHTPVPHREDQMRDVRYRADEYKNIRVGHEFKPFQIEYTTCLRQRLIASVPSHAAFEAAWRKEYDNAR